jgi:iron-sulfur cluster assembly protein
MPSARSFKDLLNKQKPEVPKETEAASSSAGTTATATATTITAPTTAPKKRVRRSLRPRKALITLSQGAVQHLRALLDQPTPQLIRIGVRNRGCSGLTYNLEYIEEPKKFDEVVEQDGVKVVIDSKALFSIVGSEMDWLDDKLSSRFIFRNPNSKGTCGCGESFMV